MTDRDGINRPNEDADKENREGSEYKGRDQPCCELESYTRDHISGLFENSWPPHMVTMEV